MASRTKKKEDVFYTAFKKFSSKLVDGAELFQDLVHDYPEDCDKKIDAINDFEHDCDKMVHDLLITLNDAFITPFDREEVDQIIRLLDDVADGINCAAKQFRIYDVHSVLPESIVLADLTLEAAKAIEELFDDLPKMKKRKKDILEEIIEVNRIENVGDDVYEKAQYNLFRSETDALHLVKWVRILDHMEDTIDSCETIANLVERVVSKNT